MAPDVRHIHAHHRTRTRRAGSAIASLLVCSALVALLGPTTAVAGIKFGAHAQPRRGESLTQAMRRLEKKLGTRLEASRVYYRWDSTFPNDHARWLKSTGRKIYMSVKAERENGTHVLWRTIANARRGDPAYRQMVEWARSIKRFGAGVHFTFNHEPETYKNDVNGGPRDFGAAWRRIHTVFRRVGARNVRWLFTMTDWAFEAPSGPQRVRLFYPGDRYVDEIGATAYNWHRCSIVQPWEPLGDSLSGIRRFGRRHPAKELVLTEWGSVEDWSNRGRKANWIDNARATFKRDAFRQFDAVLYFHARVTCTWFADTTDSALNAFRRMARDPFYT
jgi:hypothetical protein